MNARHSRSPLGSPRRLARLAASGLIGLLAASTVATAAVNPGHTVASGSSDELVILEGYNPASGQVTVDVLRGPSNLRIATTGPLTIPAGGTLEINHPVEPGDTPTCWQGWTPDIVYGDVVRVTQGATVETSRVRNVTVTTPVSFDDGDPNTEVVDVHGTAPEGLGRLPEDQLDIRLINQAWQAVSGGGPFINGPGVTVGNNVTITGTLTYDDQLDTTNPNWTARFVMTGANRVLALNAALGSVAEAGWNNGEPPTEVTEVADPNAPGPPEPAACPAVPDGRYAATTSSANVVGNASGLVIEGAAHLDATSVTVTLSDNNPLNNPDPQVVAVPSQPADVGGKVWTADFAAGTLSGLANGTLTATPVFSPGPVTGIARTVQKTADGLAPVTITAGPADGSTSPSSDAQFSFASPVNDVTFQCSLDGAPFAACTSPATFLNLLNGPHNFAVRAVDGATPGTPQERDWTINRPVPVASIVTGPPAQTNQTTATFTVAATPPAAIFQCNLDGAGFVTCPAPLTYTGLAEGPHDLVVRGIDTPGNEGPDSPEYEWQVDLTPPDTTITAGPANGSNTADRSATFSFTSPGTPTATFECRLDGAPFAACSSPLTLNNLVDGSHTFQVRAKDLAGNVDLTPATRTWEVNGPPETTITSGPDLATTRRTATFAFTSDEATATFECSLDNAPFTACSSPTNVTGLALGAHTFRVRATDPGLPLTDPTPAIFVWTIEPPATSLTQAPPASTTATSATFGFTSPNDPTATFECSLDGAAFTFCATPTTYTGLSIGSHTFRVRAVDTSSTADPTPATHAWDVVLPDTEAPTVTARLGPVAKLTVARNGNLNIQTTCDERCTIVVRARVVVTSPIAGGKTRVFKPVSSPISVNAGATGIARIKLNAIMLRAVRNSLSAGKKVRITLTVSAKDSAGNEGIALPAVTLTKKNL